MGGRFQPRTVVCAGSSGIMADPRCQNRADARDLGQKVETGGSGGSFIGGGGGAAAADPSVAEAPTSASDDAQTMQ